MSYRDPQQHTVRASGANRRVPRSVAAVLVSVVMLTACSTERPIAPEVAHSAPRAAGRDVTSDGTEQLLFQQAPLTGTNLFVYGAQEAAADFTVPSGPRWKVTRVVLVGGSYDAVLYLNLYNDNVGAPGTHVVISAGGFFSSSTAGLDPCCTSGVYDYSFPLHVTLDPATYWLSVRAPFYPQLSAATAPPAMIGQFFPSSWTPVPNIDFAFSVYGTLETPSDALSDLQTTIEGFGLDYGTLNSFEVKLQAALDAWAAGDVADACQSLQDLINAVRAQSGKKLTVAQANAIIDEANRIRGLIGC